MPIFFILLHFSTVHGYLSFFSKSTVYVDDTFSISCSPRHFPFVEGSGGVGKLTLWRILQLDPHTQEKLHSFNINSADNLELGKSFENRSWELKKKDSTDRNFANLTIKVADPRTEDIGFYGCEVRYSRIPKNTSSREVTLLRYELLTVIKDHPSTTTVKTTKMPPKFVPKPKRPNAGRRIVLGNIFFVLIAEHLLLTIQTMYI